MSEGPVPLVRSFGLVVVGELPELEPLLMQDVPVVRLAHDDFEGFWRAAAAAVVVDARGLSAAALAPWLRAGRDMDPAVLVLAVSTSTEHVAATEVEDVIEMESETRAGVARRLRLAVELGRTRLALAVTNQLLGASCAGFAIAEVSADNATLVHMSPTFERMTGQDMRAELDLTEAVAAGASGKVAVRGARVDGVPSWNELSAVPLAVRGARWMGVVRQDTTRLVEAQAKIDVLYRMRLDQRAFDQAILDGVTVGIITTDLAGRVTFANRSAVELLRLAQDLTGVDAAEVLGLVCDANELLASVPRRVLSYTHETEDGVELELELAVSRGDGVSDERLGFFFIFRDVREEKKREAEHRRFERLAAMGTMVAGFAHEVRNPVAALRSITEELSEEMVNVGFTFPHPARMLRVLERIERLVRTSLQFGRPAAPRRGTHRPWLIASAALSAVGARTSALQQQVRVEMDSDLPDVFVDEGQIAQVLVILLDNALDAVGAPQRVLLRALRARSESEARTRKSVPPPGAPATTPRLRFEVIDDGPGIAPGDLSRIFDPFFTTKPTGTGLGLSIAQQLVSENGGLLKVDSTLGGPTTFAVVIPSGDDP